MGFFFEIGEAAVEFGGLFGVSSGRIFSHTFSATAVVRLSKCYLFKDFAALYVANLLADLAQDTVSGVNQGTLS
jgi:hypothetical protein